MSLQLNDRVLYRKTGSSDVREGTAYEFSPTGKFVLLVPEGWLVQADVTVVEQLPSPVSRLSQAGAGILSRLNSKPAEPAFGNLTVSGSSSAPTDSGAPATRVPGENPPA